MSLFFVHCFLGVNTTPTANLSKKSLTSTTSRGWIINVNIVIFCTDWLFYKWLLENFPIYFYMIFPFNQIAFFRIIWVTVQNCITRKQNTFSLKNTIHFSPILYEILHIQVIDYKWIPEFGIGNCFVQWKSFRMKRNKTITQRPVFHWFIQNNILFKYYYCDIFK